MCMDSITALAANALMPEIPAPLAEAMKRGDAVLFLGAGASFGAKHIDGRIMPLGNALRDLVCDRFLYGTCKDRSLDEVASLAVDHVNRSAQREAVYFSTTSGNITDDVISHYLDKHLHK